MPPRLLPGTFYGTRASVRETGDFTLTEYDFGPRRDSPRHSHQLTYFSLVLDGCWHETYDSKARQRKPFSLTVHPAGEVHSQQLVSRKARAFQAECAADWLQRLDGYSTVLALPTQTEGGPPSWHALRLHAEFQRFDCDSPLVVEGIVLELIGELGRSSRNLPDRPGPPWLDRVREILHARFSQRLSLQSIAAEVKVHPVHLARTFRARCCCTMGEYLRGLRVQFACRELMGTDRPLAEIALAAGFVDQSHLSRLIRRFTGHSPAALRRSRRIR